MTVTTGERLMKLEVKVASVEKKLDKIDTKLSFFCDSKLDKQVYEQDRKLEREARENNNNWKRFWPVYAIQLFMFLLTLAVATGLIGVK